MGHNPGYLRAQAVIKASGCENWTVWTLPPELFDQHGTVEVECACGVKAGASTVLWGDPFSRMTMMDKLWKRLVQEHVKLNPVLSLVDPDGWEEEY